ncbi:hypothetical protein M9H77_12857 [Catharanthus roseus]|uniref:Uncharacterized protein n=1 Tax=Catharanthus roseus TaxID=4058 RepID=A0ACC0BIR8_CATRO|nr:hypothetical protein M9H77_12857 [Catharanthus roseus]
MKKKDGTLLQAIEYTLPSSVGSWQGRRNGTIPSADGRQVILEFNSRVLVLFPNPSLPRGANFCIRFVLGISHFSSQASQGSSCRELHLGRESGSHSTFGDPYQLVAKLSFRFNKPLNRVYLG